MGWLEDKAAALAAQEDTTNTVQSEPELVGGCPTCGASGDDPCVTPSGKVKDEWHSRRNS